MTLNFFKKLDITLLAVVLILILLGLIIIFSTSYNSTGTDFLNFKKQVIFSVIGFVLMMFVSFFDYRALKNWTGIFYVLVCFVLVAILFLGTLIRGSMSWFDLGFFNVQPSEFVKIIMIIILAKYLSEAKNYLNDFRKIIISGIYVSLPTVLIILQPDFGSALVMLFIWISMVFITGTKIRYAVMIFILGIISLVAGWFYVFEDYQKDRIATFVNPQSDLLGAGYNVNQSIIAVGSGNIWGKGLGYGSQSQLNFLPEKHTDFIFAVIAEEMGFIGAFFMLGLFAIVFYRFFKIALETQDNFGKLLVLGVAFTLIFHISINIGMNVGIMPVTGIPLPFISYGGSSLISFLIMIGIAQSVYMRRIGYKVEKEEE